MNRIEMIRLVDELNRNGWSPLSNDFSTEYWMKLEIAREDKLDAVIKNAPPECLLVAADLLLDYPTRDECRLAFPASTWEGPYEEEDWLLSVTMLLNVWAKYASEQTAVAIAPIVKKQGKPLAYGSGLAVEARHICFLPIVKAGVAAFDTMDDEDISLLHGAVESTPGPEAKRLLEELDQKILAQPTIGPETAATMGRYSLRKEQRREI